MRQVAQRIPAARDLKALLAALNPVLEEHGFTLNSLIAATSTYTIANVTTDRDYDANATTIDELADIVGTLIDDLKAKGILS